MTRSLVVRATAFTGVVLALSLLSACTPATVESTPNPSASSDASVVPSAVPSDEASAEASPPTADIDLGTLTDDDLSTVDSGCAIQLLRADDPPAFVYYETGEKAIVRIDGALVPFMRAPGSILAEPVQRKFTTQDAAYTLTVDTPLGEASPESDSTAIPVATITVTPTDGAALVVEVFGGLAC